MTSLSPDMYNVALLILLIVAAIWLLATSYRLYNLQSLSAAYTRHELLHVEGITRYSNLTRDHLLSILRARSSHTAHLAPRYSIAAHIDGQRGCKVRREGTDEGAGEVGVHMRLSCTRVSRLDVFVGVPQLAVAQLYQSEKENTAATKETGKSRFRVGRQSNCYFTALLYLFSYAQGRSYVADLLALLCSSTRLTRRVLPSASSKPTSCVCHPRQWPRLPRHRPKSLSRRRHSPTRLQAPTGPSAPCRALCPYRRWAACR